MQALTEQQASLIDEPAFRAMSIMYIPDTGDFQMPEDPLMFEGYKLQQLLLGMEKIRESVPGQFNAAVYRKTLNDLLSIIKQIKERATNGASDFNEGGVGEIRAGGDSQEMGARKLIELDPGISAENPFSRQRLHSV